MMAAGESRENLLAQYFEEIRVRKSSQEEDRKFLENQACLTEEQLRKMDSTLKRTTAFMKKLKNIGTSQPTTVLSDLNKINLSKFIEEMANSIAEVKIKMTDIPSLVQLCVQLSSRYADFSPQLLSEFQKNVPYRKSDKISNPSKLRVDVKLLAELWLHGVFGKEGLHLIGSVLSYLTITDKNDHINVPILLPFCKNLNVDILGVHRFSIQKEAKTCGIELPAPELIVPEQRKLLTLFLDYRNTLVEHITKELSEVNSLLRSIKRQTRSRGDASAEDRNKLEESRAKYEKLLQTGVQLSEALGLEMEEMVEEQSDDEDDELSARQIGLAIREGFVSIWPDEDIRQFYECRTELRSIVPSVLFEESEKRTFEAVEDTIDDVDLNGLENIPECDEEAEEMAEAAECNSLSGEEAEDEEISKVDLVNMPAEISSSPSGEYSKISVEDRKVKMKDFLEQLPWLINRDLIDKAAMEFVSNLNSKGNRKRLCQMMLNQQLDRLDLLPFYGRLIATLEPVMPDLALEISHSLLQHLQNIVRNKRLRLRVDSKIRTCRFIAELVKFTVIPKGKALGCIRMVLYDFRGHNIDMLCAMVDSMGPFLYYSTDSHAKMKVLLDVMMKKREKLDTRQQTMIDNAYYTCIPPQQEEKFEFVRPAVNDYIRYLVMNLSRQRCETTVRCFRKLDWSNEELADYAIRCLSNPMLTKYTCLTYLANLVAALTSIHDFIGIRVLDEVLEEIRLALEVNHVSLNQNAVLNVIYLSQLYKYKICDSTVLLKTLYQLITFAVFDPFLDDWNSLLRVKLVCQLLMNSKEYLHVGSARKKISCFLAYFYRYYWIKREAYAFHQEIFPTEIASSLQVASLVEELSKYLNISVSFPSDLIEACKSVEEIESEYKPKVETDGEVYEATEDEVEEDEERLDEGIAEEADCCEEPMAYEDEVAEDEEYNSSGENSENFYADEENGCENANRNLTPEEELFIKQYEQTVTEALQGRSNLIVMPSAEISIPTSVRHKFHKSQTGSGRSFNENSSAKIEQQPHMAVLLRGKGNKTLLKPIAMDAPGVLAETWKAEKEKERVELDENKHITLTMSNRMMADDDSSSEA